MENPPVPFGTSVRSTWQFSLDKIRADTSIYSPEQQEALIALFRWCIDQRHPMSKVDAARRLSISDNLLYKLFTGSYRHPETKEPLSFPDNLVERIQDFLKLESSRYDAGETAFVVTPTVKKVWTACHLARESQSPVILWGPSHVGKTWALRAYQAQENHGRTFLAELDAASGLGGMVKTIADSCGISDKSNTSALIERIKHALSPNSLLIIDEVHLLKHTYRLNSFFACIEVLRRIYDKVRCGMVLSWTNLDDLKSASQGELIQLWRRGVHKVALPTMPTKADLGAILAHSGLDFPARDFKVVFNGSNAHGKPVEIIEHPYDILRQLAKNQGLKSITERLRYARKVANKASVGLTWDSFIQAHLTIESQATPEPDWN